jgi:PKD repeat protein
LFTAPPFIVQFSNNTANMNNYDFLWLWGDGTSILSNNANVFHEYLFNGLYSVTLIATNTLTGCSDSIVINDYIYCSGGINSINENYSEFVTLTPNPASDFVTISSQDARYDVYTLLDAQGRIIQEGKLKGTSTLLDLSRMASGNYLLRIGHQQTVLKLVKE